MALRILQLRSALAAASFQSRSYGTARRIVGIVIAVIITALLCWGVLDLADAQVVTAEAVLVLATAGFCALVLVIPLLIGAEDPIDPRKFASLGVDTTGIAGPLLLAGLVGLASACAAAVAACFGYVVHAHGASVWLSILAGLGLYLTLYLFQTVGVAGASAYQDTKQPRETLLLIGLVVLMVAAPVVVFGLSQLASGELPAVYSTVARISEFTPLGAAAGWGFLAAEGNSLAWLIGSIALLTIGLLVAIWFGLVHRALGGPPRQAAVRDRSLGWFAVMPSTAFGGVAARSLVYWSRDRRYLANLLAVPVAAILCAIPPAIVHAPREWTFMLPILVAAAFFGWIPHNDVAYDSSALWTHAVSGMSPVADRLGRLVPTTLVAIPTLAVGTPIACALAGRPDMLPALSGAAIALLFAGFGMSSIFSALAAYPVPKPGSSPFQQPQRTSMRGPAGQTLVLLLTVLIALPVIWLGVDAAEGRFGTWNVLWIGIAVGVAVLALGVWIGSVLVDRRWTSLLMVADAS